MLYKNVAFKADSVDLDARTFTGYASTWELDKGSDIIVKGAFSKTLQESADRVKVLWQHDAPIGKPVSMVENEKGLLVTGRVSKTRLGDEALELMKDGVVDRMSIGYIIPEGKSEYNGDGVRVIREVKLMEFSPVTFPMNDGAVITGVKNISDALHGGITLSKEESKSLADMLGNLSALLQSEPPKGTQDDGQPQEMSELKGLVENWGVKAQL